MVLFKKLQEYFSFPRGNLYIRVPAVHILLHTEHIRNATSYHNRLNLNYIISDIKYSRAKKMLKQRT